MADMHIQSPRQAGFLSRLLPPLMGRDQVARFMPQLHIVLFCMMMLISLVPIAAFYTWVGRDSFRRELASVHDAHLIIAKNLSSALSRYATDAKTVFRMAVMNADLLRDTGTYQQALANFHICHIFILDGQNNQIDMLEGQTSHHADLPEAGLMQELRETAVAAKGEVVISGIRNHGGTPHFFIVQSLSGDRMALAPLSPKYVIDLQKSIAFGERGHSMVVDQFGHVVAHPNAHWQEISKDASKLSVVDAMIRGGTGVMQFYSPPMQADMIAGFTQVPETGWGVMVPQPISELAARASQVQRAALVVALVQLMMGAVLSWKMASWLSRPIRSIAMAAGMLSRGGFRTRIGALPRYAPAELVQTAEAFDGMVDAIEQMTGRLQFALAEAEKISSERAKLLEAAQAANAAKSQFVSMVSHELRTPLTSIKGSLDLLGTRISGDMPEPARKLLDVAIRNGDRLSTMIDDLLDLEKLDAGKLRFSYEQVDLDQLTRDAIETNQGYGALAGVRFDYTPPEAPILAEVDASRIEQVLANLLSNAAKFSDEGQSVEIRLEARGDSAVLTVADHGVGVAEHVGDSIFDAFVQADSSDTRSAGGSGLGLSIARMIVWHHHGSLTYDSVPGEGTTFEIEIPLNQPGAK